jgi:hypothetical protein
MGNCGWFMNFEFTNYFDLSKFLVDYCNGNKNIQRSNSGHEIPSGFCSLLSNLSVSLKTELNGPGTFTVFFPLNRHFFWLWFNTFKLDVIIVHPSDFNGMKGQCLQSFFQFNPRNGIDIVPVMPLPPSQAIGFHKSGRDYYRA